MGRQIVEDDADRACLGVMNIDQLAHAVGEVAGRALVGHFDLAPGSVRVEEDEQVDRAVAAVFAVFRVTPPSIHQMVLTLERAGLIRRQPAVARSIQLLVPPEALPILRRPEIQTVRSSVQRY